MLAEASGDMGWMVVGIVAPICVALVGACAALVISRMNRQSQKHEELRSLFHKMTGAARERASRLESRIEEVWELYWHNTPEQWKSIRALEQWKSGMCVRCDKCEKEQSESKGGS